jgi:1,4-alpha-glucan branching enzyme
MFFMGEEFGAETPFLFFCDFEKDLAAAVTDGRRNEFAHFARFSDPAVRERIPDPSASSTFELSHLDWNSIEKPQHQEWLRFYRDLLKLRRESIVPRLAAACKLKADCQVLGERGLSARWTFSDKSELTLLANLGSSALSDLPFNAVSLATPFIYASPGLTSETLKDCSLPAWSIVWMLQS